VEIGARNAWDAYNEQAGAEYENLAEKLVDLDFTCSGRI
jgi:hypothetical protein